MKKIFSVLVLFLFLFLNHINAYASSQSFFLNIFNENITFKSIISDFFSLNTLISIIILLLPSFIYHKIFKKDLPFFYQIAIPFISTLILLFFRVALLTKYSDIIINVLVVLFEVITFSIILYLIESPKNAKKQLPKNNKKTRETKLIDYIKKFKINRNEAIECLQLYSIIKDDKSDLYSYNIKYLAGTARNDIDISARQNMVINIEKDLADSCIGIRQLLNESLKNGNETNLQLIQTLLQEKIDTFKEELTNISCVESITAKECVKARILLLYYSLLAAINDNHKTIIGLSTNSLNLNTENIENNGENNIFKNIELKLFSPANTGFLGTILLENFPYVFSYMRNGIKQGRFYYTFLCGNKKQYLFLIAINNKDHGYYLDFITTNKITSLEKKINEIFK